MRAVRPTACELAVAEVTGFLCQRFFPLTAGTGGSAVCKELAAGVADLVAAGVATSRLLNGGERGRTGRHLPLPSYLPGRRATSSMVCEDLVLMAVDIAIDPRSVSRDRRSMEFLGIRSDRCRTDYRSCTLDEISSSGSPVRLHTMSLGWRVNSFGRRWESFVRCVNSLHGWYGSTRTLHKGAGWELPGHGP